MEISANFAFLKQEFPHAAESASFAERHVFGDPRASCFHARHALERLLKRVYKVEKGRCCMIQLRREWGRFSNFSFRTPQRRIAAYPARPSG